MYPRINGAPKNSNLLIETKQATFLFNDISIVEQRIRDGFCISHVPLCDLYDAASEDTILSGHNVVNDFY